MCDSPLEIGKEGQLGDMWRCRQQQHRQQHPQPVTVGVCANELAQPHHHSSVACSQEHVPTRALGPQASSQQQQRRSSCHCSSGS